jgi:Holliday junction resolvase RusA-like endonuclease
MHWGKRMRMKKVIQVQLMAYGDPIQEEPIGKCEVKITRFYGFRKRMYDIDNLYGSAKLLLDAMQELSIIETDSPYKTSVLCEQKKSDDKSSFVEISVTERL